MQIYQFQNILLNFGEVYDSQHSKTIDHEKINSGFNILSIYL